MTAMKRVTVRLPAATLNILLAEARATGRSVSDIVRQRLEATTAQSAGSVFALTADLAGSLAGSRKAATNDRPRFIALPAR